MQFEETNPAVQIKADKVLPATVNYFIGNRPERWQTNITTYAGLHYVDLYPGIDLHYTGEEGVLKGTYTLAPGADPARIGWRYHGASDIQIEPETGDLLINLPLGDDKDRYLLREQAPAAWQEIAQEQVPVEVRYALIDENKVGFAVGTRAYLGIRKSILS